MLQILVELIKLATMVITLNKSVACARRAASLFQVHPSMANGTAPAPQAAPGTPAVTFKDVSFTYPSAGAPSLRNISFSAQPGQTVGIIGGTGSGKSTLAHLLCRFYDVSSGRVLLWGEDIRRYDQAALRRQIAVVPQQATLFSGTIRDNLRWGDQDAADEALWQALTVAQARQTVEDKPGGLDFVLEQGGRNLSGGQKQRLTIARALVRQPKLLSWTTAPARWTTPTDAALRQALHQLHDTTVFVFPSASPASARRIKFLFSTAVPWLAAATIRRCWPNAPCIRISIAPSSRRTRCSSKEGRPMAKASFKRSAQRASTGPAAAAHRPRLGLLWWSAPC